MSEKHHFLPFKAGLVLGAGIGVAAGVCGTLYIKKHQNKKPDQILAQIKQAFLAEGPIEGSWIEHEAVFIDQIVQEAKAYTGGIVRYEGDDLVVYNFLAEASTGALLSIEQMEGSNL